MAQVEGSEGRDEQRLESLEAHAWKCFDEAQNPREKLAALKVVADMVLAQIKLKKEMVTREEVENVEFYEEQLRTLKDRVDELARRRGGC